ncbi:type II toxin-antitoxin system prevent-host-death family antitoxin [Spartinivicinus poritis]|uniref:Type II toxin-antitoxin system prevent-host-death family antitoxin n=1 Tax=Spartinivicinus poritis TaxID=2994640 RepID=A0ABT5UI49_9GAMM|nr:type II toxin-antitoxin system prevent-host-death family antitoxin [Spartinivicinus sp. A2-2]MDE1466068.1 type II toxin-antitoxin system prevent-host-death family antitoxin [Spartinivicinus sp. A2-2]
MEWKAAEARHKFSEVLNQASLEGPQQIVRRDETYVVLTQAEYEQLAFKQRNFVNFLLNGPSFEGLDLERDKSEMRDIEL